MRKSLGGCMTRCNQHESMLFLSYPAMKSCQTRRSEVSTMRAARRDYPSRVAWVAWIHKYALLSYCCVKKWCSTQWAFFTTGSVQPALWWRWILRRRRRPVTTERSAQDKGSRTPHTRHPRRPLQGKNDKACAHAQRHLQQV